MIELYDPKSGNRFNPFFILSCLECFDHVHMIVNREVYLFHSDELIHPYVFGVKIDCTAEEVILRERYSILGLYRAIITGTGSGRGRPFRGGCSVVRF